MNEQEKNATPRHPPSSMDTAAGRIEKGKRKLAVTLADNQAGPTRSLPGPPERRAEPRDEQRR